MSPEEKMLKARANLILSAPFFASLALRTKLISDPNCKTMWTDGISMGYNPVFVRDLPVEQVKGVICHEVMHIVCEHNLRRENRDPDDWNIACDYAVDPLVKKAGFVQPWETINPAFNDWTAEKIYSTIHQPKPKDNSKKNGKKENKEKPHGEVRDYPGKDGKKATQTNLKEVKQKQKIQIQQALQAAKNQGSISAGLERFVKDLLEPKINWKEVLSRFLTENAKNDYSWSYPNKRFIPMGIYLPQLKNPELGSIALIIDTSVSINQSELDEFATEIKAIVSSYNTQLIVIYVDSEVKGHDIINSNEEVKLKLIGGGGTNFIPGFSWLEENDYSPTACLYFTDGRCNRFPDEPDYPALWVLNNKREFKPPFGEVIIVKG